MRLHDLAFRLFWLTAKEVWICQQFSRALGCKRAGKQTNPPVHNAGRWLAGEGKTARQAVGEAPK